MAPPCAWLSKRKGVEGAASSFAAEFAREIVHGRSFRALGFCQAHGKRARGFLENGEGSSAWLMAVRRVADDGSAVWPMAARRRADAGKHYGATAICIFEFASRIAAF